MIPHSEAVVQLFSFFHKILSINYFLHRIITLQLSTGSIGTIISTPNTNCPGECLLEM